MKKLIIILGLAGSILSANFAQAQSLQQKVNSFYNDLLSVYSSTYVDTIVSTGNATESHIRTRLNEYTSRTTWIVNGITYNNTSFSQAVEILGSNVTQFLNTQARYQYQENSRLARFRIVDSRGTALSDWIYITKAGKSSQEIAQQILVEWTEEVYELGFEDGFKNGYREGFRDGYTEGFIDGYRAGYFDGYDDRNNNRGYLVPRS